MSGLKICFFVHECVLEAGHTRAMIEVLRQFPKGSIDELHLVYFEGSPSAELFPEFHGKITHHKVPFKWIFPFLFKAIFFQLWTFFLCKLKLPENSLKIGIGTACLNVDLTNVQFVQEQWKAFYFKDKSILNPRTIYKKILFMYFSFCENYLFRKESVKIVALSNLVKEFIISNFQVEESRIKTIYSSVNLEHFPLPTKTRLDLKEELVKDYPCLTTLNLEKPIHLFVGAFERKGLDKALELLKPVPDSQIIVIGKAESGKMKKFERNPKAFHITFTKKIAKFYELSDIFIFPTIYEPYGLVIAEAASMGNIVYVPKQNVGASEILEELESVHFIEDGCDLNEQKTPIELKQKIKYAKEVRLRLDEYSWKKASNQFLEFIGFF